MIATRRQFVAGAGGIAAIGLLPAAALARPASIGLAVHDSRIPASRAFARAAAAQGIPLFDVAAGDHAIWRAIGGEFRVRPGQQVIGHTAWSDWVVMRGALAENRLRVRSERKLAGRQTTFAWAMA